LREYESTFVLDAHLPTETTDATIDKITKYIESNGGKVKLVDRWGKRRLAYEISKKQYGYYAYFRFEADGTFIKEFEREFKLDDTVLRSLTVVVSKIALKEEERLAKKQKDEKPEEVNISSEDNIETPEPNAKDVEPQPKEDEMKKEDETSVE